MKSIKIMIQDSYLEVLAVSFYFRAVHQKDRDKVIDRSKAQDRRTVEDYNKIKTNSKQ